MLTEHTAGLFPEQRTEHPREELAAVDRPIPHCKQEAERGKLLPRDSITYQTANRLPVYKDFLRFWMVDIRQEGHS